MKCLQWANEQVVLLSEERRHCSRSGRKKFDNPVLCQGDPKPQGSAVGKLWSACSVKVGGGAGGVLGGWRRSRGESWEDGGGAGESPRTKDEQQATVQGAKRTSRQQSKKNR